MQLDDPLLSLFILLILVAPCFASYLRDTLVRFGNAPFFHTRCAVRDNYLKKKYALGNGTCRACTIGDRYRV